jgi:cupin 2 domain-containing protein
MHTCENELPRMAMAGSLLIDIPDRLDAECFDQLLQVANVRIERIVSTGQTTPPGEWFDQACDEWVLVVAGAAEILLESEDAPRRMIAGDYLFIPAHVRHQVTFTDLNRPTVWLALHIDIPVPEARDGINSERALLVRVECYAGHRGEETPRRFSFDGRTIQVVEVLDAWLAPDHRYFKVRGDDGTCYILRHDVSGARWELTMYDRTGAIG